MKYLRKYNESIEGLDYKIETINDICLELSDSGFYSDKNGRRVDEIKIEQADGIFANRSSVVSFHKGNEEFLFDEISEYLYRIKNIIGIENIGTFNYRLTYGDSYSRCNMKKLENETLNLEGIALLGCFITFNFPVGDIELN
jgi:hypothetical protein